MDTAKYQYVLSRAASSLWAIEQSRLDDIVGVLAFQAAGGKLSAEEVREAIGERKAMAAAPASQSSVVAVIPLQGIISHRISHVQNISGPGGVSAEGFIKSVRAALNDGRVKAIVIDVDSPGGTVDGVPEAARELRESRGRKPIVAVVNTLAASAALWIASQADEISITESGSIGSVGVFTMHKNLSRALEKEGVSIELISAGEFKTEGNSLGPLTPAARAFIQSRVDESMDQFRSALADGRGVPVKEVRDRFGEGRVFGAQEAIDRGMADRIETLEQAIARVSREHAPPNPGRRGGPFVFMN